ncbi:MAG TPA: glycosyltransferase family 39 protein [Terriglobales bacterium]|nr:glycosyltransferase family 39 protein [Terriglobales bacterium]
MKGGDEDQPARIALESPGIPAERRPFHHSIFFIVLVALLLRLAVIGIGHTYRITPRRDHFQFGWEMGRLARSIASGQGFSSPTDLPTGPSAWAPPVYPYILAVVFRLFGVYSAVSAWVILTFNSIFAALTCLTLYRIAEKLYGIGVARATAWAWAVFPYFLYWPTRVVWETSFTTFLLSLTLLLTLRMAVQTPPLRTWIAFGALWGVIVLTNTAVVSLMLCSLIWLLFRKPQSPRRISQVLLCVLTAALVVTPWLMRNYQEFGRFLFVRDNLPLEMYESNNAESEGLWTRTEHPGNDPDSMHRFQELGEIGFMDEKKVEVEQFIRENPGKFLWFTLKRSVYFWIAPPQATIVNGYDLMISRHVNFLLAAVFAFAGLWLTIRDHIPGGGLLACFLLIYPLPYYLVNPFPRYKHPIEPVMLMLVVYLFWKARKIEIRWPLRSEHS